MTASDLLDGYINNNKHLSRGTITVYERMAKKYGDMDLTKATFNDIMSIVKKEKNPNSQAAVLNIAILLTKDRTQLYNRLQSERDPIKEQIDSRRKKQLYIDNLDLPDYSDIIALINEMTGITYLINYMLINFAFRNTDLKLKNITLKKDIPNDRENYIYYNSKLKNITLFISSYKTYNSYGKKILTINDTKFINEFRNLALKDGDYLLTTLLGDNPSDSYLSDLIQSHSVSGLGETRMFKLLTRELLKNHDYKKLEQVSASRGTSLAVILSSYNMMNN